MIADLEAYERWVAAKAGINQHGSLEEVNQPGVAKNEKAELQRPKINVEQAIRELDGLERKIRALQDRRQASEEEGTTVVAV